MGIGMSVKFTMADKVHKAFTGGKAVSGPLGDGIKKATLFYEGEVKRRTPVLTGRMRSSITHEIGKQKSIVGTNVPYSMFVEYGTAKMEARYVEPGSSSRVMGKGPFAAAMVVFVAWLKKGNHKIHTEIEKRFKA